MASNAASSVQFRVNGTEMARGRTRKTERSQSMDPRAKPRAAGRLKGKRRDNRDEREFILGPENAGNFCIARRSRGISAIVSRRLPRSRLLARLSSDLDVRTGEIANTLDCHLEAPRGLTLNLVIRSLIRPWNC